MQSLSICNKKTGDKCFQSCIATGQKAMATSENFNHKQVKAFSYEGGEAIAQGDWGTIVIRDIQELNRHVPKQLDPFRPTVNRRLD